MLQIGMVSSNSASPSGESRKRPLLWISTIATMISGVAGLIVIVPHTARFIQNYPTLTGVLLLFALLGHSAIILRWAIYRQSVTA
jgi:hypothetical protein